MARASIALLLLTATVSAACCAMSRPLRVMSINDCSDQLVLALLPPSQITSVTWLSRDPAASVMARAAARVQVNHGTAEEVVRDQPDLVIAGVDSTPTTRALLRSLRFPLLEIGSADNFDDIRRTTRQVAAAVGQHARGEALIAHMDATLRELAHDAGPSLRIAARDGAGFSARPGSLYDSILRAAGGRNVAGEGGAIASGSPDIEALLATAPSLLVRGAPGLDPPGRRDDVAYHPLINRIWRGKMVFVPLSAYACGTPFSADAALRLRDQMRRAATR